MNRISSLLMAAAIGLVAIGVGVAIIQPGDMGDDDAEVSAPDDTDAPDQTEPDDPVVGDPDDDGGVPSTDTDPDSSTETTETTATEPTSSSTSSTTAVTSSTTTTAGSSGFDADGAAEPADTADGLASTGGESMILAGMALAALAVGIRRHAA